VDYIHDRVDSHSYLCKTVFLVRGLNTCKISVNYDYWYMYNCKFIIINVSWCTVYLSGGSDGGPGGHLDWQVLRAPQYVNPALSNNYYQRSTIHFTMSTKKTKPDHFSIILFRTDKIFIKFGGLLPDSAHRTTAVAFPTKSV